MSRIKQVFEDIALGQSEEIEVDEDVQIAYIGRDYPDAYVPSLKELAENGNH